MTDKRNFQTLSRLGDKFTRRADISLKTACTEYIGTNRKPDVLRILRTQNLLDYASNGLSHEILDLGHEYFTSDNDRRERGDRLVQSIKLPEVWNVKPGTEIFISGLNALRLKRDYFDSRMMALIDPPKRSRLKGLRIEQILATLDLDAISEADDEDIPVVEQVKDESDPWLNVAMSMAQMGNERAARALTYLTRKRTMAMLNETGSRVGVNLEAGQGRQEHFYRFLSHQMRALHDEQAIFISVELFDQYLDQVAATTVEAFLGFSPELARV